MPIKLTTILAAVIITGFVTMAVFSFLGMIHESGSHGNCFIAKATGNATVCPEENPIAVIDLHLGALKSFGTAVFGTHATTIFGLVLLQLFGAALIIKFFNPDLFSLSFATGKVLPQKHLPRLLLRWLSLLKYSPPLL